MTSEPADVVMVPAGRTETTVRRFDKDGQLIEEHTTVVARLEPKSDDHAIGQYL